MVNFEQLDEIKLLNPCSMEGIDKRRKRRKISLEKQPGKLGEAIISEEKPYE